MRTAAAGTVGVGGHAPSRVAIVTDESPRGLVCQTSVVKNRCCFYPNAPFTALGPSKPGFQGPDPYLGGSMSVWVDENPSVWRPSEASAHRSLVANRPTQLPVPAIRMGSSVVLDRDQRGRCKTAEVTWRCVSLTKRPSQIGLMPIQFLFLMEPI